MLEMQRVMGIGVGSDENTLVPRPPELKTLSNRSWSTLCGIVCAYRLADVVAYMKGYKLATPITIGPTPPYKELYVGDDFYNLH